MGSVFEFNRRSIFNLESANQLLPLVFRITSDIEQQFQELTTQIAMARSITDVEKVTELEAKIQDLIQRWENKMTKLGLEPKGIWLVDFDAGNGYYCWKYPELDIKFWHAYKDGFTGRKPIESIQPSDYFN